MKVIRATTASRYLSVYEEQLFYKRINAGPKTMARASVRQTKKLKEEGEGGLPPARFRNFIKESLDPIYSNFRLPMKSGGPWLIHR